MNQETITVENLYYKMQRLKDELAELGKAKDLLYEGQAGGVAHNIVKKAYDEKNQELNIFKRSKFVEVPKLDFFAQESESE